jgi:hypothetical protein
MPKQVFRYKDFFVALEGLRGARISGKDRDTITVFYDGEGSNYYHVGPEAPDVFNDLCDDLQIFKEIKNHKPLGANNVGN